MISFEDFSLSKKKEKKEKKSNLDERKKRKEEKSQNRNNDNTYRHYLAIERQGRGINRSLHNGGQPMTIESRKTSRVFWSTRTIMGTEMLIKPQVNQARLTRKLIVIVPIIIQDNYFVAH